MKILLPFFTCLAASLMLVSQSAEHLVTTYAKPRTFTAIATLTDSPLFNLANKTELRLKYTHEGPNETVHHKYHQYVNNLRVLGGTVTVHTRNQKAYATTGRLLDTEGADLRVKIANETIDQVGIAYLQAKYPDSKLVLANRTFYVANANFPDYGGSVVPVVALRFQAPDDGKGLPLDVEVYLDASSGNLCYIDSHIKTQHAPATGDGLYNQDLSFPTTKAGPFRYELRDSTSEKNIRAYDLTNQRIPSDSDNRWLSWHENHLAMVDGYYASSQFSDFLRERFNRNSIDDDNHPMVTNMNLHGLVNAFWDGSESYYGNGSCNQYTPLTTHEIVGHEFTHGLTQFTSNLIYSGESGALNEAMSDIFGKGFEWYYDRSRFNWRIGASIRRGNAVRFFRSFEDPHQRQHPKFYRGKYWFDDGRVHTNSSVLNHWFYLLVEGKRGTNQEGQDYDVTSIGMAKALQLAYLLQVAYLTESSGYRECYDYSLLAANDLFGNDSPELAAIREAWKAVGLPNPRAATAQPLNVSARFASASGSFWLCSDDLSSLQLLVYNHDTAFPTGTQVDVTINWLYSDETGIGKRDTTKVPSYVLTEPLGFFDPENQLLLDAPFPDPATSASYISGDLTVQFTVNDSSRYLRRLQSAISISRITEPILAFDWISYGEPCTDPEIASESVSIFLPRCAATAETGTLNINFYGANGQRATHQAEVPVNHFGQLYLRSPVLAYVADSDLGPLPGIRYEIDVLVDGVRHRILERRYGDGFTETINQATIEDFSDEFSARQRFAIRKADVTQLSLDDGQVSFFNPALPDRFADCIPVDERGDAQFGSANTVTLCVDASEIPNAGLTFDLLLKEDNALSFNENLLARYLNIYLNGERLQEAYINTTDNEWKSFTFPLPEDFSGFVELRTTVHRGTAALDNVGIVENTAPKRELGPEDYNFRYPNPFRENLRISTLRTLPEGTTAVLYDAIGRIVGNYPMTDSVYDITTHALPAGSYYLVISDERTFRWLGKLIKQ